MTNPSNSWGFDPNNPLQGATVCPHCRGVARTEIDDEMRYVCGVCGGPRVRVSGDIKLSGAELDSLTHAERLRKRRAAWRLGGGVSGASGALLVLAALFAFVFLGAGVGAAGFTVVLALPLILMAVWAMARAGKVGTQLGQAVDRAWKSAARDIVTKAGQPMSGVQLRKALPLPLADSEALIAELAVDNMLSSRIDDNGEWVFSASDGGGGLRIAPPADPLDAKFREMEAEQAAEQAAEEEALTAADAAEQQRRQDG